MINYQLTWILPGGASRSEVDTSLQQVGERIKSHSGKLQREPSFWDQRTLAFPIDKHETGNYCVASFSMDGDKLAQLDEELRTDGSILRHLISRS